MVARKRRRKLRRKVSLQMQEKKLSSVGPPKTSPEVAQVAVPGMDRLLGTYSNRAVISHTEREFVFDFLFALPGQTVLASRVITSPQHAKKVFEVLGTNIKRYEETFAEIKDK